MNMASIREFLILTVACLSCTLALPQGPHSTARAQTHFSAEEESVERPITIPSAIRKLLAADDDVKELAQDENIPPENFLDSWFSASAVHLSSNALQDVVLVGRGPMLGANITQFWVFCATADGYRLVLKVGAHDLFVTHRTWKGFREIDLLSTTATEVHNVSLRYDGHEYKAFHDFWQSTE
jgi:hypothetical protein